MEKMHRGDSIWRKGEPCVWLTSAALALTLLITIALVGVVLVNGLGVFWPADLVQYRLTDGKVVLGEVTRTQKEPGKAEKRIQLKIGNRRMYGLDFRWVSQDAIAETSYPAEAVTIEREEYGNFYGYLKGVQGPGLTADLPLAQQLRQARATVAERKQTAAALENKIADLSKNLQLLRQAGLKLTYQGVAADSEKMLDLQRQQTALRTAFNNLVEQQTEQTKALNVFVLHLEDASGRAATLPVAQVVRCYAPNGMSVWAKSRVYLSRLVELFVGEPRESNTEGGLFPAIFGTVMLIFLMSMVSFPMGVIAAVYLREYARDGLVVRLVRIAVNNLAGIPSIVYGIFGLAFFVYGIGGTLDRLFFPESLPTPTFGTGGILWASLTLALLTVPVVIVSTDEALGAIPQGVREGSLALGSTKFQLLRRILLPMASPGIMTGLILAMARAAGEVAPLMITGVVKLAPSLPLDGDFPFLHLDRKFMHLGFHIYDIGFQSPNVEAAKPMVYVTTLLLVLIVLVMSSVAIMLRNRMKKRYTTGAF